MYKKISQIKRFLKDREIENYVIHTDLSVSVKGNVFLSHCNLKTIPIQFQEVKGSFYCSSNQLGSLKFAPKQVRDNFDCSYNRLKTLSYAQTEIGGNLICDENPLESLVGIEVIVHHQIIHTVTHELDKIPFIRNKYEPVLGYNSEFKWRFELDSKDYQLLILAEKEQFEKNFAIPNTTKNKLKI